MFKKDIFQNITKIIKDNSFLIAFLVVGVLIAGVVYFADCGQQKISSSEAGDKVIKYINENLLGGSISASLSGITEENGFYKIKLSIQGNEFDSYVTLDGRFFFPEVIDMEESAMSVVESGTTIGNFSINEEEICWEGDKPIVYFFGSQSCGFCQWEHPIMEEVAKRFEGYIAFHNNMDSDADSEIFGKYSTGGIPTLVLGCKYSRVGSGKNDGEEQETKNLTAVICKLTDNQPAEVCSPVQDLVNQIL